MNLTKKESNAIKELQRVTDNWPESLWLFSASGTLWVMKKKCGEPVMLPRIGGGTGGGVDLAYSVTEIIGIENDGGDW